jgi:signal transduction histidine kinase
MGRDIELHREATRLGIDLDAGRWLLDGPVYSNYRRDVAQWVQDETPYAATEPLFKEWENSRNDPDSFSGLRLLGPEDGSAILIWRSTEERIVIFMATSDLVEQSWLAELRPLLDSQAVILTLLDARSHTEEGSSQTVRTASDTGLPWTLSVSSSNSETDPSPSRATRGLLLAGLVLLLLVVLTCSYLVARLVHRELQVARLQSDFVAAVSHEFRTPLTALRQVTEILNDGRADVSRMNEYHQNQARATERLQRLVEMLLDFGRMEAGAHPYRMQPVELSEWIRDVVEDFQPEAATHGHRIELHANGHPCTVEADPEALAHALRNLLDNAVKYSPGCNTVRVDLARENTQYVIRVRDEGLGIPLEEQLQIFRKFVRGSAAKAHSIKGTGVGLAMVQHIVEAHHGRIHLESQPGKGSTFSMRLPDNRS